MSVIFPLIGIAMIVAKLMDVSYMVDISWWWCGVPFVLAFIYWEFIDPVFHFSAKSNSKRIRRETEKLKKKHAEEMLSDKNYPKTKRVKTGNHFGKHSEK